MHKNKLPLSEKVNSKYLEQMLDKKNFSASYKILWLYAIHKEIINGESEVPIKKLISRMVGLAWYPIIYYKLNFGTIDKVSDPVFYAYNFLRISRKESEENITDILFNSDDEELNKMLKNLSLYVQYRLIRPLYDDKIKIRENILGRKLKDKEINEYITELSNEDSQYFYRIDKINKKLVFGEEWSEYIRDNQTIIEGWINYKYICYLQARNPSVPAIPFKIYPPMKRNLSKATNYWNIILEDTNFKDIYTKNTFDEYNKEIYGDISIDHFIPWSFVLHDGLWNLIPTFKNINSSKSNNLPNLDLYYDEFCNMQYEAFIIAKESKKISSKQLEDYYNLNSCLYELNHNNENFKDIFIDLLRKTITPLYQIATNQGYTMWEYHTEKYNAKEIILKV